MTTMTQIKRLAFGGVALMLLAPIALAAQEPPPPTTPPPTPPQAEREATDLVFEREVFRYPQFERRNPFLALDAGDAGAVRFEQLRLAAIFFSDDPSLSVAVVSTGELTVSEDGTGVTVGEGQTWNAKVGQTVGNTRILEIHPDQVVVEVEEFGIAEQKIMQLQTRRLGGTQ